ncbi:MAG: gliding motility-associated C-terminal domain-containing protein [Prevotella sp.]|nr:gliding motility-associated C-terminal domain-containing protein [Candidatus Prevotella equi]
MRKIFFITVLSLCCMMSHAEGTPSLTITFDVVDGSGEKSEKGVTSFLGSAPITATFHYQFEHIEGWEMNCEWRFCHEGGTLDEPYMIRYESDPQIIFTQGVTDSIALYAELKNGNQTIVMKRDYWIHENTPLIIKASESQLTFPNAFSPNGDGKNDTYKPKSFQSIVEFRAIIFNRWGQKIYEWNDVAGDGWDGTFNGHDAKQGVYFAYVRAKGADGTVFEFKKDVNLLRSYDETAKDNAENSVY